MGAGRKLLLLMWKNWLLQKRKVVLTIFEIGLPCVFAIILLAIRQLVESVPVDDVTSWPSFKVDAFPDDLNPPSSIVLPNRSWELLYTPDNTAVRRVADTVTQRLNMKPGGTGFATEEDLVKHMQDSNRTKTSDVLGGIVFTNDFSTEETLPEKIIYKVRLRAEQYNSENIAIRFVSASDWYTSFMFPFGTSVGPRQNASAEGGKPGYYREGFLALQRAVDAAIVTDLNNAADVDNIDVELKRHPYPPYIDDPFVDMLRSQLPFILLLGFIVIAPNIVKDLVLEKERKLKESMKMMGLNNWIHWLAWFLKYLFFMLVTVFFLTLLFTIRTDKGAIIRYSDPTIIFVFLLLYGIATIMFCFAISVFFSKSNTGAAAGGILFMATYLPYSFLQYRYEELSVGEKIGASLLHNVCMCFGCVQISLYEGRGIGLQWTNFYKPVSVDDNFTMLYVFLMFLLDIFIYGLIAWYFDAILPGDFGIPKPLYFPFTKSYWCGRNASKVSCADEEIGQVEQEQKSDYFESYSPDAKAGISIRNLRKEFKKRKVTNVAVNDMNIDMLEGQITALLGHNGAGKTTTMFMLTGFIPPTSGAAYVNGFDIRTDIDIVRQSLGLCPQHDVLFDTMTVVEHLTFFAKLKGCPSKSVEKEVDNMIEILHLEDKRQANAKSLSGGMRRKLSVGIALIADSKFLILDEPTSGMDPAARRQTWEILQNQRQGRTMILSTHFMDEADLLGDRIAIMANGVIQCCGSSLFLKKKYGVGYHMVMVKQPDCNVSDVTNLIMQYVPQAKLESNVSAELSYILPSDSSDKFENLFETLEKSRESLGIASYGASVTTMEEVFLKVGESVDESLEQRLHADNTEDTRDTTACTAGVENQAFIPDGLDNKTSKTEIEEKSKVPEENDKLGGSFLLQENGPKVYRCPDLDPPPQAQKDLEPVFGVTFQRNGGVKLLVQQFRAMFEKRVIHSWRNWLVTITQLIVPLGFTILACVVLITMPGPRDPPPLELSLDHFQDPIAPYATEIDSTTAEVQQLTEKYVSYLKSQSASTPYINDEDDYKDDPDLEQYLIDVADVNFDKYIRDYMVAGMFEGVEDGIRNKTLFQIYFNNEGYHTPAISLSVVGNTLLQYFVNSTFSIESTNHPLPRALETQINEDINTQYAVSFIVAYTICFGMAFLVGTFVVFLIKEKSVKAKHVQFVSGVHVANFWMSTYVWDLINFLIPSLLMLAVFAGFSIDAYIEDDNAGYTLMIFLFFGLAVLPFVYLLSFPFSVAATGYVWITILNIMAGSAAMLIVWILKFPGLGTEEIGIALEWTFYVLLPNFCFGTCLRDLYTNHETYKICGQLENIGMAEFCKGLELQNATNPCCKDNCGNNCAKYQSNYLAWEEPGLGRGLTFMSIQCIVCFTILFIIESGSIRRLWQKAVEGTVTSQPTDQSDVDMSMAQIRIQEDEDVAAERTRINNTPLDQLKKTDTLILKELKKYYGSLLAVDRLSLGISQGDCFGLLGINGAGKTTTFKMLTGDETISSGSAYLSGYSVKAQIKEVQQELGYCPQFDALIDEMTVKETLRMYARLRGVHEERIPDVVDAMISSLILDDHADKLAGDLSGGNKRKLNTAIALVGDPQIVFLDEPTTGMDPVARRLLWDTLSKVRTSGRTLVLTSHSMEECEALCTRLAIMVNGEFKCLGSTQHLKNKFGEGYSLTAKVKTKDDDDIEQATAALRTFIENTFPSSVLKDVHQGLVHYHISNTQLTWAQIFGTMERAKVIYGIEDYSVGQTTLEQVFINFARAQLPPREDEMTCTVKTKNCCNYCCCCGCCAHSS